MADDRDYLRADYNISTPENVTFGYELAGIGSRFIGALVDLTIVGVALTLLNVLLFVALSIAGELERLFDSGGALGDAELGWAGGLILAAYALVNFLLFWGYFVAFELLWNGQTMGKRLARTRVVRRDGNPAGPLEYVVRNLVRIIDFMPSGYGVGLIVMLLDAKARRLGDFAAGTLVVKERAVVTLDTLEQTVTAASAASATTATEPGEVPYPAARRRLSPTEIRLVLDALARDRQLPLDDAMLARLAKAIAVRLGETPPRPAEARQFLESVAASVRNSLTPGPPPPAD